MATEISTKITTGEVTFCYVNLLKPTAMKEGDALKYNVAIVIPKSDTKTIDKIKAAIEAATQVGLATLGGKVPAKLAIPLRDGDTDRPDDAAFAGCMFINAKSTNPPGIVDANLEPIIDPNEIYSGMIGRASINFYAYNQAGSKGIAAGLNNVQKLKAGTRLSGGSTPEDDFADPLM